MRRWAIIGNDYSSPRESAKAVRGSLIDPNAIVLERFVPLGLPDFGDFLSDSTFDRPTPCSS